VLKLYTFLDKFIVFLCVGSLFHLGHGVPSCPGALLPMASSSYHCLAYYQTVASAADIEMAAA
jgi:hypothetical protein